MATKGYIKIHQFWRQRVISKYISFGDKGLYQNTSVLVTKGYINIHQLLATKGNIIMSAVGKRKGYINIIMSAAGDKGLY